MTPMEFMYMDTWLSAEFPRIEYDASNNIYTPHILTQDKSYRPIGKIIYNNNGSITFEIYEFKNEQHVKTHTSEELNFSWLDIIQELDKYARTVLKPPT